jgi:AcrR family transcriptional regulator
MMNRREQRREDTLQSIKAAARQQMAEGGSVALSLRGIAASMGMTAPAIYRYFPNRDALITALIVDAFNALADALIVVRDAEQQAGAHPFEQLSVILLAYRDWAVTHRTDFELIYGNPIPGYDAPREVTVPAVVRGFEVIVGAIEAGMHTPRYQPRPPYDVVPEHTRAHIAELIARDGYPVSERALYLGVVGWGQLHGIIMLELFGHIQSVVGDVAHHYHEQVRCMMQAMGMSPP